jgi:hypothetical protein
VKRRPTREERKRRRDIAGYIIVLVCFLIIGGAVALYFHTKKTEVAIDLQTLCPLDGPEGLTVVLIDRTDPFTTIEREDLRQQLTRLRDTLPLHSAIEVYSIGPVGEELLRSEGMRLCNAGRAEDVDALTANPRLTEKRWKERFAAPLDKLFDKMVSSNTSERSPILESIQSISISAFGNLSATTKYRKLVIASDMLQNTEVLSQYKEVAPFSQIRDSDIYRRIRTDLTGVDVEILYIRRDSTIQGRKHIDFWQDYFADSGARLIHVTTIQG